MDLHFQQPEREVDLHHLQIFNVLLLERSLTKAARVLDVSQPALSKTLAKLRIYFDDPLFIRVGMRMEPTPKALALGEPVRAILDRMRLLRSDHAVFDPLISRRKFSFFSVDAAVVQMLPPVLDYLRREAPQVHIQAVHCDAQYLDLWLESGLVDFAVGAFPALMNGIRRHPLWRESYVAVVRREHPRLGPKPSLEAFIGEQHALVSAVGTGHEYLAAEHALEAAIPPANIVCMVPTFVAAAMIAKHSDVVATLPQTLAEAMARDLDLRVVEPPISLPFSDIGVYWHDRFHRDPASRWIRTVFQDLFART
jgi:DNA-binding transcriptional LysR family regulator